MHILSCFTPLVGGADFVLVRDEVTFDIGANDDNTISVPCYQYSIELANIIHTLDKTADNISYHGNWPHPPLPAISSGRRC